MDSFAKISEDFVSFVWGFGADFLGGIPLLVVLLLLAGLCFTLIYRFPQFRHFKHAVDVTAGKYDKPEDKGEISHFQALCAALSATIGLGNIAGVAVAIAAGGPGAVFWMWLAALVGAATKFTSISLSLIYREVKTEDGETVVNGGPMYTIKQGLGKAFLPLAFFYAVATILSSFGAGNMFQSQSVASLLSSNGGIPPWVTGVVFAALTAAVILGGIKRIGSVAGKLVPTMVVLYFGAAVVIVLMNLGAVPELIKQIFVDAFTGTAAVGGFTGVTIQQVIAQGIRRAVFSNEAGMGTAATPMLLLSQARSKRGLLGYWALYRYDRCLYCDGPCPSHNRRVDECRWR